MALQEQETELGELLLKLGYSALNPMQEGALASLDEQRLVVAAPTASGKTLLALIAIARNFAANRSKAVYVVPLRALASEKFDEFQKALAPFGVRVGLSTGDYDSSSEGLGAFDVVIVTSEKMDSLLRHKAPWIKEAGLCVIDEMHLLNDEERGATLEIVVTKLRELGARMLFLSATLPNARELAAWLDAGLYESAWRPTRLELGICDGKKIFFAEAREKIRDEKKVLGELCEKALAENDKRGQGLFFVSTRRNAEALAQELGETAKIFLTDEEKERCAEIGQKALRALGTPTRQCRLLASCLENGTAFHHAGLPHQQRRLIEKGFKQERCLKAIACTTTLAMGIDYPASWVVVRDLKRFNGAFSDFIPNLECAQMTGRAGRPRFDSRGIGVLCCKPNEKSEVAERYVFGPLENIYSKLASEPVLRSHVLALVASDYCRDNAGLRNFFGKTFFAHQYGDAEKLFDFIEGIVSELKEMDFLREKNGVLLATPVGRRVSELYIDPLSARSFLDFIGKTRTARAERSDFAFLMALNDASEARPLIEAKRTEEKALWEELYALFDDFDLEAIQFDAEALDKYKSAKVLNAWINEETEDGIMESFGIPPGVLHSRARIMEWLAYALQELAFLENAPNAFKQAKALRRRIKHGVKQELLELCRIRGVGRVRARRLWNAGIRTSDGYRAAPKDELKKILRDAVDYQFRHEKGEPPIPST